MTNYINGLAYMDSDRPVDKCAFCGNEGKGMFEQPQTGKHFHFDCWIKNMVNEQIDERLKDLKIK